MGIMVSISCVDKNNFRYLSLWSAIEEIVTCLNLYETSHKVEVIHHQLKSMSTSARSKKLYSPETTRLCPYILEPTRLCPDTIVPRHDCAQTRLCPGTFVPTHVCAHTRLCPHTIVPTHDCAHTRLCPHMFVPRHICALTYYNRVVTIVSGQKHVRLCPDTYLVP